MKVTFTEFVLPDGQCRELVIWLTDPVVELAVGTLESEGYRFEVEILRTGEASAEIVKDIDDEAEERHVAASGIFRSMSVFRASVEDLIGQALLNRYRSEES